MDSAARRPASWFPCRCCWQQPLGIPGGMLLACIGVRRFQLISWIAHRRPGGVVLRHPTVAIMLPLRLAYGLGLALIVTSTGRNAPWRGSSQRPVLLINSAESGYGPLFGGPGTSPARLRWPSVTDSKSAMVPVRGARTERRNPVAGGGTGRNDCLTLGRHASPVRETGPRLCAPSSHIETCRSSPTPECWCNTRF